MVYARAVRAHWWIVACSAGCGFNPVAATNSDAITDGSDGPGIHDAPIHHDAAPGAEPPLAPMLCHAPDPTGLVLCLELDDPGLTTALDGSGLHHDATVANLTAITRTVPASSQGAQITSTSVIQTADSADFDLQTFTLMLWVHRENTPGTGGEYSLIDVYDQYRMRIDDQGKLSCIVESPTTIYVAPFASVVMSDWDLVACTYDGANVCGFVFDPTAATSSSACMSINHTLDTSGMQGVSVGALNQGNATYDNHLAGKLDSARIFSRVLTTQEICVGGGLSGC